MPFYFNLFFSNNLINWKRKHRQFSTAYRSYGILICPVVPLSVYGCTAWMLTKLMEKKWGRKFQRFCVLFWTIKKFKKHTHKKQHLRSHLPTSKKIFKWNQQDTQKTVVEAKTNSKMTFCYVPLHIDTLVLAGQQELTSAQWGHNVIWRICRDWWMIKMGRERERQRDRGKSEQSEWHNDDDDIDTLILMIE